MDATSYESETDSATEENDLRGTQHESPFLSVYETAGQPEHPDPETEALAEFLNEVHDGEFNDALLELVDEASALVEDRFAAETGDPAAQARSSESLLTMHLTPLVAEFGQALDMMEKQLSGRDLNAITDDELEELAEAYVPSQPLPPEFENLFGKLAKKAARAIAKGAKAAAKVAGGFVLGKFLRAIKKLAPVLLRRVVSFAINKLPAQYRPLATKVAQKLGVAKEAEEENEGDMALEATENIGRIQDEFDQQLAELVFARNEVEMELLLAEAAAVAQEPHTAPLNELDRARERFIREFMELEAGQDPAPVIERFIPAALFPALKLGLTVIGRKKVVNYLARYLARLIKRWVGKRYATPLSRALVDAGLRLIHLEATPEDEMRAAAEALAMTVEETARKVAAFPEDVLEDEELLEASVLEAFEEAATANFPDVLSEEVYEQRPDLREAEHFKSAWIWQPLRGPKRYKKCTRIFDVSLTPHAAQAIITFGGHTLAEFLRDRLGLPSGRTVKARVHLYESVPGTSASIICRYERGIPGLGAGRIGSSQLHLLTPIAAGLLCGAPGLGRDVPAKCYAKPHPLLIGQRLYMLEIAGSRPQTVAGPRGAQISRQPGSLTLSLDFPQNKVTLRMFFSEAEAQQVATRIRERARMGLVWRMLRGKLREGLSRAFSVPGRIKANHEVAAPGEAEALLIRTLPPVAATWLKNRLSVALRRGLVTFLRERAQEFVAATEQPLDGVSVIATVEGLPGLAMLGKGMRGAGVDLRGLPSLKDVPNATIRVVAGH